MRTSILRAAGSLLLLILYGWAVFTPRVEAGPPVEDLRGIADASRTSFQAGRYDAALGPTLVLHEAHPANLVYLERLAGIYGKLGRDKDEAAAWERWLASSPTPQDACPHIGNAYFRQGLIAQSVDAFTRCLAFDPADPDAQYYLARANLRRGHLREAREGAEALIAVRADHVDALLVLGLAHQREGHLPEARAVLERGLRLEPGYVDFDTALGLIAEAQGRLADARVHYGKALALTPQDPEARARLQRLAAHRKTP
jgi:tetratricopeptide (TPR) repeat protein